MSAPIEVHLNGTRAAMAQPRPEPPPVAAHLHDQALVYQGWGWSVIVVNRDKEALVKWRPWTRSCPSEADLRGFFALPNVTGIAVVLGRVSGRIVVRDFDTQDAYRRWAGKHKDLSCALPTVKTFQGYHVYARVADGATMPCTRKMGDGEFRSDGAYVVLPPSLHPRGVRYQWLRGPVDGHVPVVDMSVFLADGQEPATDAADDTDGTDDTDGSDVTDAPNATYDIDVIRSGSAQSREQSIDEAIELTAPSSGNHDRQLWSYVRRLKTLARTQPLSRGDLRSCVRRWWTRHKAGIVGNPGWTYTWGKAARAWSVVKTGHGDSLTSAVDEARALTLPGCLRAYADEPEVVMLGKLCFVLAQRSEQGQFLLSFRTMERALGIPLATCHGVMEAFKADGLVRVQRKGRIQGKDRTGTVWRWVGQPCAPPGKETP